MKYAGILLLIVVIGMWMFEIGSTRSYISPYLIATLALIAFLPLIVRKRELIRILADKNEAGDRFTDKEHAIQSVSAGAIGLLFVGGFLLFSISSGLLSQAQCEWNAPTKFGAGMIAAAGVAIFIDKWIWSRRRP